MNSRVEKLIDRLNNANIDGILVKEMKNVRWLSGFTGTNAVLLITPKSSILITDFRYIEQATFQAKDFEIRNQCRNLNLAINEVILEQGINSLGYEDEVLTCAEFAKLKAELKVSLVAVGDMLFKLRQVKEAWELERIKKAEAIGDKAFEHILNYIKEGRTEKEIALELEFCMRTNGAEGLSFSTIVASGINSSMPHAYPKDKAVEKGDFITMDYGCLYEGYCSDMTRTVVLGKATDRQREIYNIVLEAQEKALASIHAGVKGEQVDKVARDYIAKAGYGDNFGHGLGHSLGLDIHENPRFALNESSIIETNMVLSVEPGIYIPNYGGVRIEDIVVITEKGYINLTSSSKQLIEL